MKIRPTFIVLLFLLIIHFVNSVSTEENSTLISDGMHQMSQYSSVLDPHGFTTMMTTTVTCEPIYGFLPCTTTLWGQLFMLVVYEVLLSISGEYVQKGSDLFFKTFGTGIFGASLFQMLGLIPQLILVIVSAVSSSEEAAEASAAMGMGLLAGSVIINLTLVWGSIVAFGSHNLSDTSASSDLENAQRFSFTGYGVTTDVETRHIARIMILSMIPFLILQLAKILNSSSARRVVVLISLIVSFAFLAAYCTYQVFEPLIQNRRLEYLMQRFIQKSALRTILIAHGKPDVNLIKQLFGKIDRNSNSLVSSDELRAFILGIQVEGFGLDLDENELVENLMQQFDTSADSQINEAEFVKGLSTWLAKDKLTLNWQQISTSTSKQLKGTTDEEQQSLVDSSTTKSKKKSDDDKPWRNYTKAAFLVIVGTGITILLAQPLTETVQDFSTSANIPSFFVSYVVIPLALQYQGTLKAITLAREKTEKAISLTFSETYGGVFMNNMLGLFTFLLIVYIRDLTWDVSAEVLAVLVICTVMGLIASFRIKFPFWTSIVACLLYPLSLLLIYLLTTVFGWS